MDVVIPRRRRRRESVNNLNQLINQLVEAELCERYAQNYPHRYSENTYRFLLREEVAKAWAEVTGRDYGIAWRALNHYLLHCTIGQVNYENLAAELVALKEPKRVVSQQERLCYALINDFHLPEDGMLNALNSHLNTTYQSRKDVSAEHWGKFADALLDSAWAPCSDWKAELFREPVAA